MWRVGRRPQDADAIIFMLVPGAPAWSLGTASFAAQFAFVPYSDLQVRPRTLRPRPRLSTHTVDGRLGVSDTTAMLACPSASTPASATTTAGND